MLDGTDTCDTVDSLELLDPSLVAFAESEQNFFDKSGPLPTSYEEQRRFVRFYLRKPALLTYASDSAVPGRIPGWFQVLTTDISREGLGLVHTEQLYPGEIVHIMLPDGKERPLEVMWCKKVHANCFASGAKFTEQPAAPRPAAEQTATEQPAAE